MNARDAKREACRRAASCLSTAMDSGWPVWDEQASTDEPRYGSVEGGEKVAAALKEIIDELDRRGGGAQ
jgi:hypothetical protein